tara:strand:+ start:768 stop:1679 length:912 start_codon:yes stop_codon:yes gene_type:complete
MKYKLIVENFRKFIKEEEEKAGYDASQAKSVESLLRSEYSSFVKNLKNKVESDPKFQNFLQMGLEKYDGSASDDVVEVEEVDIPVKELYPTQNQIGLADSLGWTSKNNPSGGGKTAGLSAGAPADVGGRIITADGTHIVDGHHRWSQVYLLNPEAAIPAYNFKIGGSGKDALKLAHLAIAAVDKGVPLQAADAETDVYATKGDPDRIKQILDNPNVISDNLAKELQKAYEVSSREEVVNKIAENAASLYDETKAAAGQGPVRALMPQTGGTDDFGETDPKDKVKAMQQGSVNWNIKGDKAAKK